MTAEAVIELARQAVWLMLVIAAPSLVAALIVGVAISILQALTQIQESTLSFLPKLLAILAAQMLTLPYALGHLGDFTRLLLGRVAAFGGP
ncbi:MAG: flagellar biosynthesis protein FliQ [Geminicoccaceae bacterium]